MTWTTKGWGIAAGVGLLFVGLLCCAGPILSAMQPGAPAASEHHKHLEKMVGVWDAEISFMGMPSKAVETNRLTPGGLWLISEFEGNFAGMPFEGYSMMGYDTRKKKYVMSWVDSMSTEMTISEGTLSQDGKTFTFRGKGFDPFTGELGITKNVDTFDSPEKRTVIMSFIDNNEAENQLMSIKYTKRESK